VIDPQLLAHCTPRQVEVLEAIEAKGSCRKAADALGVDHSYVSRTLNTVKKKAGVTPVAESPAPIGKKILVLPDVQAKPGNDFSYLMRIGQYMVEKKPDVVVCIGDFADMESLSSYDKGKKSFEGRRYKRDIEAAKEAMSSFLTPLVDYNAAHPKKPYKPRMVLTLGNHEARIDRATEDDPKLDGVLSIDDLQYKDFGWEVFPFLEVVKIGGVLFSHYFISGVKGLPVSSARALLTKKHISCVAGHKQGYEAATDFRGDGVQLTAIIAGSCYEHDERYMGPQGNKHWRGFLVLHEVQDGSFDLMQVSLKFVNERYPHLHVAPDFSKEHEPVAQPEGMR
jgi:hypothetical protein